MQKQKPKTPYQHLMRSALEFARSVVYPKRVTLWTYGKDNLNSQWTLTDLYERVSTANMLGYETVIKATGQGLEVIFVEKRPTEMPNSFSWSKT